MVVKPAATGRESVDENVCSVSAFAASLVPTTTPNTVCPVKEPIMKNNNLTIFAKCFILNLLPNTCYSVAKGTRW
jgi:hypothetical protein